MASKTFSAREWFAKNGANAQTTVKTAGLKYKLEGLPTDYTDAALAKLAEGQVEPVKVSTGRTTTSTGASEAGSSKVCTGKEIANLIRESAAADTVIPYFPE